jgi:hypothetical protein
MSPRPEWDIRLQAIASRLGIPDWRWLDALINNESSWDPVAMNPGSSAKGLIQFIDSTARTLGFTDSYDLITQYADVTTQLEGPVFNYLNKFKPFPTMQSLYLAVFYPAARTWDPLKPFPDSVQQANPGITTPQDYVSMVNRKAGFAEALNVSKQWGLPVLLLIGGLIWMIMDRKARKYE